MKTAICTLQSLTPLTLGGDFETPKLPKELSEAYEIRTWKERAHYNDDDHVIIPGIMFGNSIKNSADFLGLQIPGRGKERYTKHFKSGIFVINSIITKVTRATLKYHKQLVPADGIKGSNKKVRKLFPKIDNWEGIIHVKIGDDIITPDVFETVLRNAGFLIGIGTWRPQSGGYNGQFEVIDIKWEDNGF